MTPFLFLVEHSWYGITIGLMIYYSGFYWGQARHWIDKFY